MRAPLILLSLTSFIASVHYLDIDNFKAIYFLLTSIMLDLSIYFGSVNGEG